MSTGKKHSRDWDHDEDDGRKEKKKAEKKVEKVAKMLGYSNDVNPFGDTNLLKPFVWGKKQDQVKEQKKNKKDKKKKKQKKSSSKKKKDHRSSSSSSSSDDSEEEEEENEEEKRLKLLQEIEKVRQRRETREKELEDMQRLRDEEQRLRELAAYSNWQDKEEEFHLEQIKERTKLRLLTNRCHLIDRIITNIVLVEAARHILTIFQNNHKREVEELLALSQFTSSSQGKWKEEEEGGGGGGASSSSLQQKKNNPNRKLLALLVLPSERDSPVDIILQDQRYLTVEEIKEVLEDLLQLQQLDERRHLTKYKDLWTSLIAVLSSLEKKKQRQEQLRQQQGTSLMSSSKRDLASFHESIADDVAIYLKNKTMAELVSLEAEITQNIAENKKSQTIDLDYWEYMVQEIQFEKHKIVINQVNADVLKELKDLLQSLDQYGVLQKQSDRRQGEDRVFLYRQKQENASESNTTSTNKGKGGNYPVIQDSAIDEYMREMENEVGDGMDESEETKMLAADEIFLPIPDQQYHAQDKYRPRKPRYFNRVKTGWDRNKYNLTHYDPDNPPPKMIQGYKFTIFYPDLIDKTVTPRYFIEPCPDSISSSLNSDGVAEFVMIRFHAGPPYEDIAFKIINKQWDTHKRSGFISTFDRGILQLHFNFKRVFYRR